MAKPKPSRYAAALQYLQQMRDRAADFGGGVVDTLGERARDVGGLAYEAFTSDPNIGRMTTAEFSQAAADRPSTPRLDATAQGVGALGKALVTQPVQTAKAVVVDPVVEAFESPRAMGQFAGEFVNPLRIAAALRKTAPIAELDVYHGTPHRFPATEANPLGEFDASKIGTGEGAQAYGHGIYLAEKPNVAQDYQFMLSKIDPETVTYQGKPVQKWYDMAQAEQDRAHRLGDRTAIDRANAKLAYWENVMTRRHPEDVKRVANDPDDGWPTFANYANSLEMEKFGGLKESGSLYKADLPDDMIDRMLDWDKPLSEQGVDLNLFAPTMKASIQSIPSSFGTHDVPLYIAADMLKGKTGMQLYKMLVDQHGDKMASKMLKNAGIPGIRYLDAGSRGKDGTGTRNFVVFPGEEKKVKILKRD
jgi:hypothetical protein